MIEGLIEALRDEQAKRCHYGTRDGDGMPCDCKFGGGAEGSGCAELRAAILVLTGRRNLPH